MQRHGPTEPEGVRGIQLGEIDVPTLLAKHRRQSQPGCRRIWIEFNRTTVSFFGLCRIAGLLSQIRQPVVRSRRSFPCFQRTLTGGTQQNSIALTGMKLTRQSIKPWGFPAFSGALDFGRQAFQFALFKAPREYKKGSIGTGRFNLIAGVRRYARTVAQHRNSFKYRIHLRGRRH